MITARFLDRLRLHTTYRGTAAALVAGFVLSGALFLGSIFTSLWTMRNVEAESAKIAANSVPSVLRLSSARTALRRCQMLLSQLAANPWSSARSRERQEVDEQLGAVEHAVSEYFELPGYERERSTWPVLASHLTALRRAFDELRGLTTPADDALAARIVQLEMRPNVDGLDDALGITMVLHARVASDLARDISSHRRTAGWVALGLAALCVVVSGLLVTRLLEIVRRHSTVLERNAELERTRADELELFSGRMAHDIRGPLTAASMAMELASKDASISEKPRGALERGWRSLRRAAEIIDGLYAFAGSAARPSPGASCDVAQVLAGVLEDLQAEASAAGITVQCQAHDAGLAACQAGVLASIASNLVRNSLKFMGGAPVRLVQVAASRRDGRVRIDFHDTGPGIPPAVRGRIFDPYVRGPGAASQGLGLGLATVKRLVVAHGGSVAVDSTPEEGAAFTVELPAAGSSTGAASARPRADTG